MKRIGILTFWSVPNYGCFFQAYALQKIVGQISLGASVEQIACLNKKHYRKYYGINCSEYKLFLINPRFYKDLFTVLPKKIKLRSFISYYKTIPHSPPCAQDHIYDNSFDLVVLGSDIIWDASNKYVSIEKQLFGVGANCPLLSYGPSCGNATVESFFDHNILNGIKSIDFISVRDSNSKKIIETISGREAKIVLDPTLLYDFHNDENITGIALLLCH